MDNASRITGPLWGKSTGEGSHWLLADHWVASPASGAYLLYLSVVTMNTLLNKQSNHRWCKMLMWRHCNEYLFQLYTLDGEKVGKVNKMWSGVVQEVFTEAQNFGISCKYPLWLFEAQVHGNLVKFYITYKLHKIACHLEYQHSSLS